MSRGEYLKALLVKRESFRDAASRLSKSELAAETRWWDKTRQLFYDRYQAEQVPWWLVEMAQENYQAHAAELTQR